MKKTLRIGTALLLALCLSGCGIVNQLEDYLATDPTAPEQELNGILETLDDMAGVEILRADGWGEEAMSWAVGAGIISELRPNDCPDRGEVAAIVAGFANKYYPAEAPN